MNIDKFKTLNADKLLLLELVEALEALHHEITFYGKTTITFDEDAIGGLERLIAKVRGEKSDT